MSDASTRALHARLAAHEKWATHDPVKGTAAARAKFMASFLEKVDAECPGLPDEERLRRAEHLKKAHYTRLAMKSAEARKADRRAKAGQS